MPNRILRDWTDSISFDGLSPEAERLFCRLIMKADDFGRFHADPRLVRAACFPLVETLRTNDLTRWLDELSTRQLILRYEADQRNVLAIVNYGQRLKMSKAKFPPLPGECADWLPTSRNFPELPARNRKEVETETEEEKKGAAVAASSIPDLLLRQPGFAAEWEAFRAHRKKKRDVMTPRAEELIFQDLAERPHLAVAAIQEAIKAGWKGIRWDWLENRDPKRFTAKGAKLGGRDRMSVLRAAVAKYGPEFGEWVRGHDSFPKGEDDPNRARESMLVEFLHSKGEKA